MRIRSAVYGFIFIISLGLAIPLPAKADYALTHFIPEWYREWHEYRFNCTVTNDNRSIRSSDKVTMTAYDVYLIGFDRKASQTFPVKQFNELFFLAYKDYPEKNEKSIAGFVIIKVKGDMRVECKDGTDSRKGYQY